MYDFSKFIPSIKLGETGTYQPFNLKTYWENENEHPFFIKHSSELIGFALVECGIDDEPHSINEFFIMKNHSGKGYGSIAAADLFERFPGRWKITQIPNNYPAQSFWRKVVNEYTNGNYSEYYDENRLSIQEFDTVNKVGITR
jgi:predicted acetyltransferase